MRLKAWYCTLNESPEYLCYHPFYHIICGYEILMALFCCLLQPRKVSIITETHIYLFYQRIINGKRQFVYAYRSEKF